MSTITRSVNQNLQSALGELAVDMTSREGHFLLYFNDDLFLDELGLPYFISSRTFNISITDTISTVLSRPLGPDAVTVTDARNVNLTHEEIEEAIAIIDAYVTELQRIPLHMRVFVSDLLIVQTYQVITDTIQILDSLAYAWKYDFSDSLAITDSIRNSLSRSITEAVSLLDTLYTTLDRAEITESVKLTDVLVAINAYLKSFTENISVVDALVANITYNNIVLELVQVLDSLGFVTTYSRSTNDVIIISDRLDISGRTDLPNYGLLLMISDKITTTEIAEPKLRLKITESIN
jgi:hypothetical protein